MFVKMGKNSVATVKVTWLKHHYKGKRVTDIIAENYHLKMVNHLLAIAALLQIVNDFVIENINLFCQVVCHAHAAKLSS